jgi:hypothetical protein
MVGRRDEERLQQAADLSAGARDFSTGPAFPGPENPLFDLLLPIRSEISKCRLSLFFPDGSRTFWTAGKFSGPP